MKKTISYSEAVSRSRYTEHGRMLLDIVQKNPGIHLETLVRKHDPAPRPAVPEFPALGELFLPPTTAKSAIRNFPTGGRAVRQLCDAGALVITEELGVYRPEDLPERLVGEPLTLVPETPREKPPGEAGHRSGE